ncbi:MAG: hypothetical protein HKP51_09420 [Sulfitobacter sp.]|nr:hypothetical protein [Sulfitobacter sp.]
MLLFALSFLLNATLTLTVSFGIWRDHPGITEVYGGDTPARRILMCIYIAIGVISLYALGQLVAGNADVARNVALTLFPLQIIYKVLTAAAVRVLHPVVIANLCVVALLSLTLLAG